MKKNQIQFWNWKTTITEMEKFTKFEMAEERIKELEDRVTDII